MKLNTKYFEEKLTEEKKLLEEQLAALGIFDKKTNDWGATPEKGDREADDNDAADRLEDFGERSSTLGELEIKYHKVNNALQKIKKGKYGICEVCKEEIEEKRMEAEPTATTCIEHLS